MFTLSVGPTKTAAKSTPVAAASILKPPAAGASSTASGAGKKGERNRDSSNDEQLESALRMAVEFHQVDCSNQRIAAVEHEAMEILVTDRRSYESLAPSKLGPERILTDQSQLNKIEIDSVQNVMIIAHLIAFVCCTDFAQKLSPRKFQTSKVLQVRFNRTHTHTHN